MSVIVDGLVCRAVDQRLDLQGSCTNRQSIGAAVATIMRISRSLTQNKIVIVDQLIATAGENDRLANTETHGDGVRISTAIGMRKGNPFNGRRRRVVVMIAVNNRLIAARDEDLSLKDTASSSRGEGIAGGASVSVGPGVDRAKILHGIEDGALTSAAACTTPPAPASAIVPPVAVAFAVIKP